MMIHQKKFKRGQLTIFIILAIIIIVGIASIFLIKNKTTTTINPKENPSGFIEKCLQDSATESSNKIFSLGGSLDPEKTTLYNKTEIAFLCYTEKDRELCRSLNPKIKQTMEEDIRIDSISKIESCFASLKKTFSKYNYEEGDLNYTIEIAPRQIIATAKKKIVISNEDESQEFSEFSAKFYSPAYDFILVSNEILRNELNCQCGKVSCSPNLALISGTNLNFRIGMDVTSRIERIYTIGDRNTNQEIKFAVRNCVIR